MSWSNLQITGLVNIYRDKANPKNCHLIKYLHQLSLGLS